MRAITVKVLSLYYVELQIFFSGGWIEDFAEEVATYSIGGKRG